MAIPVSTSAALTDWTPCAYSRSVGILPSQKWQPGDGQSHTEEADTGSGGGGGGGSESAGGYCKNSLANHQRASGITAITRQQPSCGTCEDGNFSDLRVVCVGGGAGAREGNAIEWSKKMGSPSETAEGLPQMIGVIFAPVATFRVQGLHCNCSQTAHSCRGGGDQVSA